MNEFPSAVQKATAKGVAGDKASLNPVVYTDSNYIAGDTNISAGAFVWADESGLAEGVNKALSTGSGEPLGLVEREHAFFKTNTKNGAGLNVALGARLSIVRRGDFYVTAATLAEAGQKVFAMLNSGALKTANNGASVVGAVETSWRVTEGGAAGDLITISNWEAN